MTESKQQQWPEDLQKYRRLLARCTPYAVINKQIRPFCDVRPLGLEIPPHNQYNPFLRSADDFLNGIQWLDRMTFGFYGMEMPRWVFYDCSEMPGGICGFTMPREEIPESLFSHRPPATEFKGEFPVSMAIAIPMVPAGSWLKHTLCSINELSHTAPPGLRTITMALTLSLFRVRTLYATTQWRASELRVHTKFGELELLTAFTPSHTDDHTLTFRFDVSQQRITRALAGKEAYAAVPPDAFFVDADDAAGLIALQRDLEAGHRLFICGRPVRDGAITWVPVRRESENRGAR
ncbi:MAG: hypothetical protein KC561_03855 [Myxococcales bacterium]|nr:hypothetical protein [Myxococcales bacterium]